MRSNSVFILCLFSIFLTSFCKFQVSAQISSQTEGYSGILNYYPDTVLYPGSPKTDPFFVFHASAPGSPVLGSLAATPPNGASASDFIWSKYNPGSNTFDPPFFTETGVSISRAEDLSGGCYQVHITSTDLDTIFRAWVFPNDCQVKVEKGPDGKVIPYGYTCDYLRLSGIAVADTITYYNLSTGQALFYPNGMDFEWTSDNPDFEIFGAKLYLNLTIYNQPPWSRPPTKDTRFTLTAVDSFGLTRVDDVFYETVHVKAEFSLMVEDEENPGVWIEEENPVGESPLEVRFINASSNGAEFRWTLVDSAKTGEESEIITEDVNDSVVYTYYIPGYYFPTMMAISDVGCVDSFPLVSRIQIQVEPSELNVGNVFTLEQYYPNPTNDLLTIETNRLEQHTIEIHSLNGQLLYSNKMEGPTLQIDLSSFQKGLYFITVRSRGYVRTEKIIKL